MDEPKEIPLFVYGTLQKGYRANERFLQDMNFLGEYRTAGHLLDMGNFPGLVIGGSSNVLGEAYLITASTLKSIDNYEGEGWLYHRRKVTVSNQEGQTLEAWTYEIGDPSSGKRHGYERWTKNYGQNKHTRTP